MSSLLFNHERHPQPQQRQDIPLRRSRPDASTVIEISDDDDSDSHVSLVDRRRPARKVQVRRSPVIVDSGSGSDTFGTNSIQDAESEIENASPAHKRVKFRHVHMTNSNVAPLRHRDRTPNAPQALHLQNPANLLQYRSQSEMQSEEPTAATPMLLPDDPSQADDSLRQPPYYHDAKLDCRMYQGPGYEYFPVALGTVDGHQEKCDEWDAVAAVEAQRLRDGLPPEQSLATGNDVRISDDEEDTAVILDNVLDILPEVEHSYALKMIREHLERLTLGTKMRLNHSLAAHDIVSGILDAGSYPKESSHQSRKAKEEVVVDETGVTIVWDKNLIKNGSYLKDAVILLFGQFPHVPTHYIYRIVQDKRSIFDSYIHINNIDNKYYTLAMRPYSRHRSPRMTIEKKYVTRTVQDRRDPAMFPQMVNELQAAKQHIARESLMLEKQKEKEDAEAANLLAHKESGDIVQCQCCFDDEIPMNRAVACQGDAIHFFCFGCVNQLADTQVGLMKYEMNCMDGGGCKAHLSTDGIGQAIPMKTFDRLAFNQQQAEITAAGIEGLEQCPFCDFKGICGPIEEERVFNCQNPDCFRATCRGCKEDAHVPKTCEEAKTDKGLSARHIVEEARTEAMVRTCPKCKVKIIKELGCNKMMCNQCRCIMCYVCKADISNGKEGGYEHFNKQGSKCPLYDKHGHDMHDAEADAAEEEAIRQVKADDAELDENQLRIETGKDGKKKVKQASAQPPPVYPPAYPPPPAMHIAGIGGGIGVNYGPLRNLRNNLPLPRNAFANPYLEDNQVYQAQLALLERQNQVARQQQVVAADMQRAAADGRIAAMRQEAQVQVAALRGARHQANNSGQPLRMPGAFANPIPNLGPFGPPQNWALPGRVDQAQPPQIHQYGINGEIQEFGNNLANFQGLLDGAAANRRANYAQLDMDFIKNNTLGRPNVGR